MVSTSPENTSPRGGLEDPGGSAYPRLFALIALLGIAAFAWVWWGIGKEFWDSTKASPATFDTDDIWIAGILASAVATSVAAALGVEIAKFDANSTIQVEQAGAIRGLLAWVIRAFRAIWAGVSVNTVVPLGIVVYILIGVVMVAAIRHSPAPTPDFIKTMVTSVLGIIAGVLAVAFRSTAK